jgi:hypothetical protein
VRDLREVAEGWDARLRDGHLEHGDGADGTRRMPAGPGRTAPFSSPGHDSCPGSGHRACGGPRPGSRRG